METMPNGTVQYDVEDGVATVLLDRPETLNSMNDALMLDIQAALARVDADLTVGVVVLTGAGRAFCAGADLNGLGSAPIGEGSETPQTDDRMDAAIAASIDGMAEVFNPTMRAVRACRVPTIARVNGAAAGGGLGLSLACDITIAADSAFFVATFGPRLGIVPDLGSTWSLPNRIGQARAMGIAMLGDRIGAPQAAEWGMIWKSVPADELDTTVAETAAVLKNTSAEAMRRIRSSISTASARSFSDQLDLEHEHQSTLIPMNMVEGAAAFIEKREPNFTD